MTFAPSNSTAKRGVYLALFLNVSFMLLWVGQLISYLGDRLDQMTLLQLVQGVPDVNTDEVMTLIGFFTLLPFVLCAAWAGPTADRYSRKGILLWVSFLLGVLVASIPWFGKIDFVWNHRIGMIYLATFLIGVGTIFFYTAKTALIPQIVGDNELMAANSLSSFAGTLMTLVGTFVSVPLMKLVNAKVVSLNIMFYLDAASYVISGAMFAFIIVKRPQAVVAGEAAESFGQKLREGLRYVNGHRRVFKLIALAVGVGFLSGIVFAVVNGLLLGRRSLNWDVPHYALGVGVLGIGMLAGAILTTLGQKKIRSFESFVAACFGIVGVGVLACSRFRRDLLVGLPQSVVLWEILAPPLFVMGMCGGALIVFVMTLLQRSVPRRFHGRVFALNSMCEISAQLVATGGAAWLLGRGMLKTVIGIGVVTAVMAVVGTLLSNEFLRHRFLRTLARVILKLYCRVKHEGREHVPNDGALIVACNHVSWLDTLFLGTAISRLIHYVVAREYYDRWYLKWIMWLYGAIPIERGKGRREPWRRASTALSRGRVVGIFPEGQMSETGEMQPLQGGVALLADESKAPILPVAIIGANRVMGPHDRFPRPHKVRVRIGPPIDPTGLTRDEILARVDAALRGLLK